ncbi:MAG: hypothetical protein LPK28_01395 [Bacteroidota bacterium]|nr:hypothetical protein [Bacteroidota bacterium]
MRWKIEGLRGRFFSWVNFFHSVLAGIKNRCTFAALFRTSFFEERVWDGGKDTIRDVLRHIEKEGQNLGREISEAIDSGRSFTVNKAHPLKIRNL